MNATSRLIAGILLLTVSDLRAAFLFVSPTSTNPTPPYDSWATAATNIQDAVTAAQPGSLVLVTNGIYSGGLVVDKPIFILSVMGAQFTAIDGGGTNRCVWMTNGTKLEGFTVTSGWAGTDGGGVWCSSTNAWVTNCVLAGNAASGTGGGAFGGLLGRCTLRGNTAGSGGGAASATLNDCAVAGNRAVANGGGVFQCYLNNCLLTTNSSNTGGGASGGTLNNCTLSGNQASSGGGAQSAALNNSIVYFNSASGSGNNADSCTLNYCCTTPLPGAGAGNIDLEPRFVDLAGGNLRLQSSSPCINAGNNALVVDTSDLDLDRNPRITGGRVDMGAYEFPNPVSPVVTVQPQTQSVYSGTGVNFGAGADGASPLSWQWYFNGTALATATGSTLALAAVTTNQAGSYFAVVTNSFGSDTSHVAVLTVVDAAPTITRQPGSQTAPPGTSVTLTADAQGSLPLSWQWQFNGTAIPAATTSSLDLGPLTSDQVGNYAVVVTNAFGSVTSITATVTIGAGGISYVWANSPTPTPPYSDWSTAAHTIQDALNAATPGGQVLVTNGAYGGGVSVGKALALVSVNGPQSTVINAGGALITCVTLTNGSSLTGFTLTGGYGYYGGGVYCPSTNAFLTNCVLLNNRAQQTGGGAYGGTLYNCTLTGNVATNGSGGAGYCTLINCTVTTNLTGGVASSTLYNCVVAGNTVYGGGVQFCTLFNCTVVGNAFGAAASTLYNSLVYYNTDSGGANYDPPPWAHVFSTLDYCCTTPMPTNGVGNITNAPLLLSPADGNLRLQSGSPCINAGNNAFVSVSTDRDGNPRVVNGTVDIGAYEFQGSGSAISYAWLQQYGLPTDGSADLVDTDGDGMNNWQEWICGTNPTNALSVLRMLSAVPYSGGVTITWRSVAGITYFLERTTDVSSWFISNSISNVWTANAVLVATNITGQAGSTSFVDATASGAGPFFYRVGVKGP